MTVVTNFLMIVEVIVSILLIVVVVAQNSKNAGNVRLYWGLSLLC